jgi:hypothetical protein
MGYYSHLRKPVCAIAGTHVDEISKDEIAHIMRNREALVEKCIEEIFDY